MENDYTPVDQNVDYESPKIKTAADRFREIVTMPDFGVPEVRPNDEIFAEAPTPLPLDLAHSLVDGAKIREGLGEQTAVAVENALTSIGGLGDQATLAFGQLTNYITGNSLGEDFMEPAFKSLEMRKEDMMYAEDSVGGIRNLIAQLGGGAVSMGELFLTSLATGGVGAYLQMGVEAFGEGAYNDMKKYADEHDGSLKGYEPKTMDVAINTANAFLQGYIEKHFGVGKKSFINGWEDPLLKAIAKETIGGFEQEAAQSFLSDLAEVAKGNEQGSILLENAENYLRDGIVGAILQGSLGAATYHYNHNNAVKNVATARAMAKGRETPNAEDMSLAKNIVNAKERGYASGLTQELKSAFDASTGEGQLQAKIANALKKAAETKELDLDTANETEMAQRIEQIATQETLNAMDYAREQGRAISDMELNDIVYKDGAIWLEGLTPQVGDRAVSYARVLAERQSGLAQVNSKLDTINQEIATLKQDLAEAKQQNQASRVEVLQARIDKQNALAEKNRVRAEKLKAQTSKLEKQIAEQFKEAPKAETVEMAKVSQKVKPVKKMSLKVKNIGKQIRSLKDGDSINYEKDGKTFRARNFGQEASIELLDNAGNVLSVITVNTTNNGVTNIEVPLEENRGKHYASSVLSEAERVFGKLKAKPELSKVAQDFWKNVGYTEEIEKGIKQKPAVLKQGSISGKGDTARGGYDEQLKRIILGEKSDLSTIQHEFAHYWMQNNFKWARSGLASQDWLRKWRDVEEWLGIEPQDRLLSKSASEKFAKAYERYILEGKVAPELQWAFEGFQKAYQDIYDDLENEYFDLNEELAPEVVDWFNRNKEQSPRRLLDADEKKVEKALTLASGTAVMEDVAGTVVMTEPEANGDQKVYMGVKESEIPAGDNLLVQADKTTASKLQRSAKNILSDKVEVQQLATLDTQATLQNFKDWIARDRAGAWDAMMNPDTRPIYRTYLYKAFAEEALNDVDLAIELANVNMAESVRELGQAIQALDIRNISGFDTLEIIRNIEKSKGTISSEELNKEVESIGLNMVELSQDEIDEVDFDTECKL